MKFEKSAHASESFQIVSSESIRGVLTQPQLRACTPNLLIKPADFQTRDTKFLQKFTQMLAARCRHVLYK